MSKFQMPSDVRAKHVAHEIRDILADRGIPIKLSKTYEITARIYGFGSWNALKASFGSGDITPDDSLIGLESVALRRIQHIKALVEAGLPADVAADIIDSVRPTERGVVKATNSFQTFATVTDAAMAGTFDELLTGVLSRCPPSEVVSVLSGLQFIADYGRMMRLCSFEETVAGPLIETARLGMTLSDLAATMKAVAFSEVSEARDNASNSGGAVEGWTFTSTRLGYGGSMDSEWIRRMEGILRRCPHASGRHFVQAEETVRDMGLRWSLLGPLDFDLPGCVSALESAHSKGGKIQDIIHVLLMVKLPPHHFPEGSYEAGIVENGGRNFVSRVDAAYRGTQARNIRTSEHQVGKGYFGVPLGDWVRESWLGASFQAGVSPRELLPMEVYAKLVHVLHWYEETESTFMGDVARAASLDSLVRVTSRTGGKYDSRHGLFITPGVTHGTPKPGDILISALGALTLRDYADYLALPISELRFERVPVDGRRSDGADPAAINLGLARRMPWMYGLLAGMPEPALHGNEAVRIFMACHPVNGFTTSLGSPSVDLAARVLAETHPRTARMLGDEFWDRTPVERKWRPVRGEEDFRLTASQMEHALETGFPATYRAGFEAWATNMT